MKKCKLGDILDVMRGTSLSGEYYSEKGEKIRLTLGNFDYPSGGFKNNTSKSDIYFNGTVKPEFILKKGDIITPLTEQVSGLLGETARIPKDDLYIQSGDIGLIIPNESLLDRGYAYYLISSSVVKKQLGSAAQQTKIRHTSPDKIKDCTVWLPNIVYQRNASELLDMINFKIMNNKKINSELESMTKTIYDYWFLQFEFPNEEGKPYKSSGGKMVWNEELKREIPEGWEVKKIRNFISIIRGVSYDKKDISERPQNGYIPLLKANNIQNGNIDYNNIIYVKGESVSKEQFLDRSSVFITMSSGSKAHMGKTAIIYDSIPYTFGAFCSKIQVNHSYRAFLSTYFRGELFKNSIEQLSIGTNINNINNSHIYGLKIPIPTLRILKKYEDMINPVLDKQGEISKENKQLSSLRDFLLPLLMNGQIGFKENIGKKEMEAGKEEAAASVHGK